MVGRHRRISPLPARLHQRPDARLDDAGTTRVDRPRLRGRPRDRHGEQGVPSPARPAGESAHACFAAASHKHSGMRFNDGRCDHDGRFWVSSMVHDMSLALADGVLHSLSIDARSWGPRLAGLVTGNGLAFSPTGDRLYLSDSHPTVRRVWASISTRRAACPAAGVHRHASSSGRPDGAAVDAEGGYWICANDGGMVLRFTPDGVLDRQLRVPFAKPSMCAFGGPDLDQLHVTSIRPRCRSRGTTPPSQVPWYGCTQAWPGCPNRHLGAGENHDENALAEIR